LADETESSVKRALSVIRDYTKNSDMLLLALCLAASAFGVVLIYSATRSYETDRYVIVQIASIIIGVFLYVLFSLLDIDIIANKWLVLFIFNVAFISTLFIWGVEGGTGNKSWLRFAGIGIQPSEIVKVSFIILLGKQLSYLRESRRGLNSIPSVASLVVHFGLIFGLIIVASSDLGSALVFAAIFITVLFAAGLGLYWFLLAAAIGVAASPFIWNELLSNNQKERILAPYFPESVDPTGLGVTWQAGQSKIALASGKLTGEGLLKGTQSQSSMLPFKHTDFIFSVAGEELGMIGCTVIIALLLMIIIRCIFVGLRSKNYMNILICTGIAAMLIFQSFENIGMCLGLTPVIGITLPLFSSGGSSIITIFAAMGIVSGIYMRPNPNGHGFRYRR